MSKNIIHFSGHADDLNPHNDRRFWPVMNKTSPSESVSVVRAKAENWLTAMERVIDVADRKTDEFEALRRSVMELTLLLHCSPSTSAQTPNSKVEREKADADAAIFGAGYLVNGMRVDPSMVSIVTAAAHEPLTLKDEQVEAGVDAWFSESEADGATFKTRMRAAITAALRKKGQK